SISASGRMRGTDEGLPIAKARSITVFPITGSLNQPNAVWLKEDERVLSSNIVVPSNVKVATSPTTSSPGSTSNPIPEGFVQLPKTKRLINSVNKSLV